MYYFLRCDIPVVFQLQYRNKWETTVLNTTECLINSVDGGLLSTTTCFGPQVAIIRLAPLSIISTMCDYGILGVEIPHPRGIRCQQPLERQPEYLPQPDL
jgi:hypothetical protein